MLHKVSIACLPFDVVSQSSEKLRSIDVRFTAAKAKQMEKKKGTREAERGLRGKDGFLFK